MTGKDFDGSGWQRVTGQKARDGCLPSAVSSRAGSRCCSTRRLPASPLARCGAWPSQPGSASLSGVTSPRLLCDTQCAPALLGHRFPACRALLCLLPRTWFLFGCHHSPSSVPTRPLGLLTSYLSLRSPLRRLFSGKSSRGPHSPPSGHPSHGFEPALSVSTRPSASWMS